MGFCFGGPFCYCGDLPYGVLWWYEFWFVIIYLIDDSLLLIDEVLVDFEEVIFGVGFLWKF